MLKYRGNFGYNEKNPKSYALGRKQTKMKTTLTKEMLIEGIIKAIKDGHIGTYTTCEAIAESIASELVGGKAIDLREELFKFLLFMDREQDEPVTHPNNYEINVDEYLKQRKS